MMTNNYKKYLYAHYAREDVSGLIDWSGASRKLSVPTQTSSAQSAAGYGYILGLSFRHSTTLVDGTENDGIYFGTGSTPATADDYTLEAPISSGLSLVNSSSATAVDKSYKEKAGIFRNTTDADITIREIGFFGKLTTSGNSGSTMYLFLVDRTVLDEPITIPAGEARTITVRVDTNFDWWH